MKYFYDRKADSLYLSLAERPYGDSVEAAPGVVLDFDADGRMIGLDLERASKIIDVTDLSLHEQPTRGDVDAAILDGTELKKSARSSASVRWNSGGSYPSAQIRLRVGSAVS